MNHDELETRRGHLREAIRPFMQRYFGKLEIYEIIDELFSELENKTRLSLIPKPDALLEKTK